MASYGAESYTADKNNYTGLVYKFAKQMIEGENIQSRYGSLFKGTFTNGRDLEIAVYKNATGVDYSAINAPSAPFPTAEVLYYKESTPRTYAVTVDDLQIRQASKDSGTAMQIAQTVVQTLYGGKFEEENENVIAVFKGADADKKEIVEGATFKEISDKATADKCLQLIKDYAKLIKFGSPDVNPKGIKHVASHVVMLIPTRVATAIDVYSRMGAYQSEYDNYNVDEVLEYVPESGEGNEIYIFDTDYAQFHRMAEDSYKEKEIEGCNNVQAFLHTFPMYAGCGLFSCVRMKEV